MKVIKARAQFRKVSSGKEIWQTAYLAKGRFTNPIADLPGGYVQVTDWLISTRLKDKNGADAYEGDIVTVYFDGHHEKSEVFFDMGCFCIKAYNNDPGYEPCLGLVPELDIETIGNITENPDLLS